MRARGSALAVALWMFAALVLPAQALAAGGTPLSGGSGPGNALTPFSNPGAPTATATTPTVTQATTSTSGGGLNGTDGVVIGIGAIIVLGGISFFIWRDARKRAPVRHRVATATGDTGSRQRPQKARKLSPAERRRRKRGKAR